MKKIEISQNVIQYSFVSQDRSFSDNIYVIHKNNNAIIIDTAFEENAKIVKDDLAKNGIAVEKVIISHFHDDHISGNSVFKECEFLVHPAFSSQIRLRDYVKKAFSECTKITLIHDRTEICFEGIFIKLFYSPGHHISGLTILINNNIVFANDLIIFSNDGKTVIPYVDSGSTIEEHISSLNFLRSLNVDLLISGHGPVIGSENIEKNIQDRVHYLEKLLHIGSDAEIKDCLLNPVSEYSHVGFHFSNLQKVYKKVL